VTDREFLISLVVSLSIHVALIASSAPLFDRNLSVPVRLPVRLVGFAQVKELEKRETFPAKTVTKPKVVKITAPKLLSEPQVFARQTTPLANKAEHERKEREKPEEDKPQTADFPEAPAAPESRWDIAGPNEGEGRIAPSGRLPHGDIDAATDLAIAGLGQEGGSGVGRSAKGGKTNELTSSTNAATAFTRPLDGYQIKPRYPESARRARAEGTTLLKFRVLATGNVGEIHIEKSSGRPDLDEAAAEAVKSWLFEPARMGKEPVAVWVTLPIEFRLN
jgi:protein TonB